jgi:hypothetical protein
MGLHGSTRIAKDLGSRWSNYKSHGLVSRVNHPQSYQSIQVMNRSSAHHLDDFKIFQNISTYFKISQNISKYFKIFKIFQHISKYFKIFQNISTYFKTFQNISNYLNIFQDISKYFKIFQHIQNISTYFKICQNISNYSKVSWCFMLVSRLASSCLIWNLAMVQVLHHLHSWAGASQRAGDMFEGICLEGCWMRMSRLPSGKLI